MGDAAVGSISHILKTAFKDVYEDSQKREDASNARLQKKRREEELRIEAELNAKLLLEEELQQAETSKTAKKDTKAKPDVKKETQNKSGKSDIVVESPRSVLEERDPLESSQVESQPPSDPSSLIENYYSSFELLKLDDKQKSILSSKSKAIQQSLKHQIETASELSNYLSKQREIALSEELYEEEMLKKQGIMLGQHIPSLKSKLIVDRNQLYEFNNFSDNLIIASELVDQNKMNALRRTGMLPISEEAEQREFDRTKNKASIQSDQPHYLVTTNNTQVRRDNAGVRFATTFKMKEANDTERREKTMSNTLVATTGKKKKTTSHIESLSIHEKLLNEEVLKSINHKLNYLKNPRNNPSAVTKMLIKSSSSSLNKADEGPQASASKKSYDKSPAITDNPLFVADPKIVEFIDFNIGDCLTKKLSFRNVSAVSRTVRIIPPSTTAFTMSPLKFPANSKAGIVAPGMTISTIITFRPITLADYEDSVSVETESGGFKVSVIGHRESPQLSLPPVIDVGICLLGDAIRMVLTCTNSGGGGTFNVIKSVEYIKQLSKPDFVDPGCLRMHPLTVYPTEFTLQKHDSIDFNIEFIPLSIGKFEKFFVLHCDNKDVKYYTVKGECRQINMTAIEINNVSFNFHDKTIKRDVFFQPITIGSDQSQELVVINDTGVPVEYEWVFVDSDSKFTIKDAQKKVKIREELDLQASLGRVTTTGTGILPSAKATPALENSISRDSKRSASSAKAKDKGKEDFEASAMVTAMSSSEMAALYMNENGDGDEFCSNSVLENGFQIDPARGVLSGEGAETFTVSFTPSLLNLIQTKAVLMVKCVPYASMPNKQQDMYMKILASEGHGKFIRLRSWVEDLGEMAEVTEYKKHNGDISNKIKLTNLRVLLDMISRYAATNVEPEELFRVSSWIRKILKHFELWTKHELEIEDEHDHDHDDTHNKQDVGGIHLHMYHWPDSSSNAAPIVIYPVKLKFKSTLPTPTPVTAVVIPSASKEYSDDNDDDDDDDYIKQPEIQVIANALEVDDEIHELSFQEKKMLAEVFIDSKNALNFLGTSIASYLDNQVNHEAVDYIRDCSLGNTLCLETLITGSGKAQTITVLPPRLHIGGELAVGRVQECSMTLRNPSNGIVEVDFLLDSITVRGLDGTVSTSANMRPNERVALSIYPSRILLLPEADTVVHMKLTPIAVGKYEISIPTKASNESVLVDSLHIIFTAIGPKLRFNVPEVDIGLVGVGYNVSKMLSFTNDSDIPAKYFLKTILEPDLDAITGSKAKKTPAGAGAGASSEMSSARSLTSRSEESTASGLSVMTTESGNHITSSSAEILIDNPVGIIQPNETVSVMIKCQAGKLPQRVRGTIECTVFDVSGKFALPKQCLSFRGEVQAPKTVISPMFINLGKVYVGVPVSFDFNIQNLCNLATKYKIDRPGGVESSTCKFVFSPAQGPLGAKELITIKGEFTASAAGVMDEVIACKIFGVKSPLGFIVKAFAKCVQLEIYGLLLGQEPPKPLARPYDAQLPGNASPPIPKPIESLDLGSAVPLYERKTIQVVVRNFSAISTSFAIAMRKHVVMGSPAVMYDEFVRETHPSHRSDLVLASREDGEHKFSSVAGKKYIADREQKQRDKKYLQSGLGASYFFDITEGVLEPWGVHVFTVYAFNDMAGCFDDIIDFDYKDGTISKSLTIPIKMSVEGCPLVIETNTVGMTSSYSHKDDTLIQYLNMGHGSVNCEPLVRELVVRNNGSNAGRITWKVRGVSSKVNGPLKIEFKVRDKANNKTSVKSSILFWDDVVKDTPFNIVPTSSLVKPYSKQNFKVALFRTSNKGLEKAQVSGFIAFENDKPKQKLSPTAAGSVGSSDQSLSAASQTTADSNTSMNSSVSTHAIAASTSPNFVLSLLLEGSFAHPTIKIDKNIFVAEYNPTNVSPNLGIKLKLQAPILFGKESKSTVDSSSLKTLTLVNPMESSLIFSISTDGPFAIKHPFDDTAVAGVGKEKDMFDIIPAKNTLMSSSYNHSSSSTKLMSTSSSAAGRSLGKAYNLLPHASTSFAVSYTPRKELRESLMTSITSSDKSKQVEEDGNLIISYSTGQKLYIPLKASIATPFITSSSPRMSFGTCLTTHTCDGTLLLSNPTGVQARWTLSHVPGAGSSKKVTAIRVRGFEDNNRLKDKGPELDDPNVFEITPTGGILDGPTVSVAAAISAPPKDQSRSENGIVPQRFAQTSWALSTLTVGDTLQLRHNKQHQFEADAFFPEPVKIVFKPKKNAKYSSRFRFSCEFGNAFDIILQGEGTFEEHEHKPLYPAPR